MEVKTFSAVTETHHNAPFMPPSPGSSGGEKRGGGVVLRGDAAGRREGAVNAILL